ncbi:glycyl-radical enzyme activating protein [Pantoea sp. RRHST58]|uniref:glycyl-radical enzyme activating protein n=1 Tax=Pantoea sp. RRHST58 TaxID=3425183 RepID=UPI003DA15EAC
MKLSAVPSCVNSESRPVTGAVFNIQRFSLHDGPGVRTVVFLKGCHMACDWCANPESWHPQPEVFFDRERCQRLSIACTQCCPGRMPDPSPWSAACESWPAGDRCPAAAIRHVGSQMSVDTVMRQVLADVLYYRSSGGGMTLSGGEMALQPEFSRALLLRAQEEGIHSAVETSGFVPWPLLWHSCEVSRLVLFDIKFASDRLHQRYTGVSNKVILANLRRLLEQRIPVKIRIPVIPHINDSQEEAEKIIKTIADITGNKSSFKGIDLLPYHPFGLRKYTLSGKVNRYAAANPDPPPARTAIFESLARARNIEILTLSYCIG